VSSRRPGPARAWALVSALTLGVAIGLTIGIGPLGGAVAAHTELLQASPGPSQRVGGTVDFVDLVFLAPVSSVEVEIDGPDGPVPSRVASPDGQIIHVVLEPIETPGSYQVTYRMRSNDGDDTEGTFLFTYQPGAPEPPRFDTADLADGPSAVTGLRVLGAALVVGLIGLCLILTRRLLHRRAELAGVVGPGERPGGS
jgi:methionine-rich copper-binding protein CopC